jgi:CBS domain-containing protein
MAKKGIHHLPVVDDGRLVGMLGAAEVMHAPTAVTVGDCMQRKPVSVQLRATLSDAAAILAAGMFHSLPVIDASGAVVGIVTSSDLIRALLQQLPATAAAPGAGHEVLADAAELDAVVHVAEGHHQAGDDPEGLSATLLYLYARVKRLERVLAAADLYLHSGQGEREHRDLTRAVTQAREAGGPSRRIDRL